MANEYPQSWQDRARELYPEVNAIYEVPINKVVKLEREAYMRGLSESKVLIEALEKIIVVEAHGYNSGTMKHIAKQALATFPC